MAASASAVPVTFDLADSPDSYVKITDLDKVCLGSCGASVRLNPALDSLSATLNAGQSWTFDFFAIRFYGLGAGSGTLEASLGFDAPLNAGNADGNAAGGFVNIPWLLSGGVLDWTSQPSAVTLSDGTSYSVLFQDLFGITLGNYVNVRATLTLNSGPNAVGVPEPGLLGLFGLGLLGIALATRRRRSHPTAS